MSTSWNVECIDHPNARHWLDEGWGGSGDVPARQLAELWRRRRVLVQIRGLVPTDDRIEVSLEFDGYRTVTPYMLRWVLEHSDCHVQLVNEYGDRLAVDSLESQPPRHCRTCSCEPRVWP